MAAHNQLRARLDHSQIKHIEAIADEQGVERPDAERAVVEEGLASLGYLERPTEPHALLLYYVRQIGLLLGLVGLVLIGYGIFGSRLFSVIGFGIATIGMLMVITADLLPRAIDSAVKQGEIEAGEAEGEPTS